MTATEVKYGREATLGVGDVVRLKSGSPKLVIDSVTQDAAGVTWFDGDGHPQKATFPWACLEAH